MKFTRKTIALYNNSIPNNQEEKRGNFSSSNSAREIYDVSYRDKCSNLNFRVLRFGSLLFSFRGFY